nr:MAG TPA: hypothetical protein [Caudoviricetes sp.]
MRLILLDIPLLGIDVISIFATCSEVITFPERLRC